MIEAPFSKRGVETEREIRTAQIFVAVLGASNDTDAEATWSQGLADWIGSHVRAFAYFDGAPAILVPDNLRSGVSKAHRDEPDLNPTDLELANHDVVKHAASRAQESIGVGGVAEPPSGRVSRTSAGSVRAWSRPPQRTKKIHKRTIGQLQALLAAIDAIVEKPERVLAKPVYDRMNLVLAVKSAARRMSLLGFQRNPLPTDWVGQREVVAGFDA